MSLFAAIAVVCFQTASDNVQCEDYYLSQPQYNWEHAQLITNSERDAFDKAFNSGAMVGLNVWLHKHNIPHSLDVIVDIDIQMQQIDEETVP